MSTGEQGVKNRRKVLKQVGKSRPIVIFIFLEAGVAKPCTQSGTKTLIGNRFADRWGCQNQAYLII